jgi:mannosyltransferase OCH1-like enzyme
MDIGCKKSLLPLLSIDPIITSVFPETQPWGVSNDFFIAKKNDPFLATLIKELPRWDRQYLFPYVNVMFSTGPAFVSIQASRYSVSRQDNSFQILPEKYYNGGKDSFLSHKKKEISSWHDADAKLILWITKDYNWVILLAIFPIVAYVLYVRRRQMMVRRFKNV